MPLVTLPRGILRMIRSYLDLTSASRFQITCKRVHDTFQADRSYYRDHFFFDIFRPSDSAIEFYEKMKKERDLDWLELLKNSILVRCIVCGSVQNKIDVNT